MFAARSSSLATGRTGLRLERVASEELRRAARRYSRYIPRDPRWRLRGGYVELQPTEGLGPPFDAAARQRRGLDRPNIGGHDGPDVVGLYFLSSPLQSWRGRVGPQGRRRQHGGRALLPREQWRPAEGQEGQAAGPELGGGAVGPPDPAGTAPADIQRQRGRRAHSVECSGLRGRAFARSGGGGGTSGLAPLASLVMWLKYGPATFSIILP